MENNSIIVKKYIIKRESGEPWSVYQKLSRLGTEELTSIGLWHGGISPHVTSFDTTILYYYHREGLFICVGNGQPSPYHPPPVMIIGNNLDKILIGKSTLENVGGVELEELSK